MRNLKQIKFLLPANSTNGMQQVIGADGMQRVVVVRWILMHPDLRHTARVKALMRYKYESLVKEKNLIEGKKL